MEDLKKWALELSQHTMLTQDQAIDLVDAMRPDFSEELAMSVVEQIAGLRAIGFSHDAIQELLQHLPECHESWKDNPPTMLGDEWKDIGDCTLLPKNKHE